MNERKVVYLDDAIEEVCDCVCGELKNRCAVKTGKSKMPCSFYDSLCALPSAQPETCAYWDSESNFCALHRPSAQQETYKEKLKEIADELSEKFAYMNTCLNERDTILGYLGVKHSNEIHCNTDCTNAKCESYHFNKSSQEAKMKVEEKE